MPQKKSAKKELRKSKKRTARNKQIKRRIKDMVKNSDSIVAVSKEESKKFYDKLQKMLDKAAKTGNPIKKNKANRIKSRMAKKINKLNTEKK
ncbi:MAG: 30S ribosomal protein S20 [Patescibacteria group bacterium]|nr:30S ribosomal protein S20 [Patescibacteria group bacterium]